MNHRCSALDAGRAHIVGLAAEGTFGCHSHLFQERLVLKSLRALPSGEPVAAISLRPVWACAVAWLGKDVENRSYWPFAYRGPILIHSSAGRIYRDELEAAIELGREDGVEESFLELLDPDACDLGLLPRGAIVAVANLKDVVRHDAGVPDDHPALESPWANKEAKYWLYLDDVVPIEPVPYKGRVGLFKVPYDIAASLREFAAASG